MPISGVLRDKAIDSAGGIREFKRQSIRYNRDLHFFEKRKSELTKKHDKMWVAVYNDELVGYNKNLRELLETLKKKGIPEESALIQFISSEHILTLYIR